MSHPATIPRTSKVPKVGSIAALPDLGENLSHLWRKGSGMRGERGENEGANEIRAQHDRPQPAHVTQHPSFLLPQERQDDGERVFGE